MEKWKNDMVLCAYRKASQSKIFKERHDKRRNAQVSWTHFKEQICYPALLTECFLSLWLWNTLESINLLWFGEFFFFLSVASGKRKAFSKQNSNSQSKCSKTPDTVCVLT
jgi:hypothetical protein